MEETEGESVAADSPYLEAIEDHLVEHLGPIPLVFHEAVSEYLPAGAVRARHQAVRGADRAAAGDDARRHGGVEDLKLDRGLEALLDPLDAAGVTDVVDPRRPSSLKRRKRFGLL
jgi:hypothetical protein